MERKSAETEVAAEGTTAEAAGTAGDARSGNRTHVRWLIAVMLGLGLIVAFIDRANLSVAITDIRDEYGFGPGIAGIILGAWVWTYAAFQLPAGWLTDRVRPRFVYAAAMIWWSAFTAATGLVRGVGSLLGVRLLMGMGEAPLMPASAKAVSEWFPKQERATASGIYGAGSEGGAAIAVPLVAGLLLVTGWREMFLLCGLLGVAFSAIWIWIYRAPRKHRWASPAEVAHIESGGAHSGKSEEHKGASVRWVELFRYRTVWGMFFGYICRNFLNYFFITWYPAYLISAEGFSTLDLAKYGAIPGIVAVIANFGGGAFSDWLLHRGVSLPRARKIPIIVGTLAAGTVGFSVFTHSAFFAIALLSLAYAGSSFASASILSLPIDVAPGAHNVSSIYGIQNFGSQIGGLACPIVIGFLVAASGTFVVPLILMSILCLIAVLIYGFVVKVQPLRLADQNTPSEGAAQ
ncbi:MAG: MFS transporter [Nocardioidaceae bacterium]